MDSKIFAIVFALTVCIVIVIVIFIYCFYICRLYNQGTNEAIRQEYGEILEMGTFNKETDIEPENTQEHNESIETQIISRDNEEDVSRCVS